MIHAFKYDRRRVLASHLASMVTGAAGSVLDDADAVVPVPLHPWRAVARGFNQADDLAQHFKRPVWRVLRRARRGLRQAVLAEHVRETNVRGAFHARSIAFVPFPAIVRKRLKGATVVVIDDVMTTGATLDACSYALREAGVKDVRALTVARSLATMPR